MANIGPAYGFYFGAGFLFLTAGIAAPLTILVAGIAIALLGNTLSEFSRAHPSTGGFISFVGKTFGGTNAGREGLLPRWLGKVHPTRRTPVHAMFTFITIAALIIAVWAVLHLAGGPKQSGQMSALNFFVDSSKWVNSLELGCDCLGEIT